MKFRLMKSKKGISPILATLLLIVIAVAAISVTYAWIMTYMGTTTDKAENMMSLYAANSYFVASGNVTLDIGNQGSNPVQIMSVYAGTSDSSMTPYTPTYIGSYTSTIASGAITRFYIPMTFSSGTTYYFKVQPVSGNSVTFSQKAP